MYGCIDQFRDSCARISLLLVLHNKLSKDLTAAVDLSDILRASYVLLVSALDSYFHQIVLERMMDVLDGKRSPSKAFLRFRLSAACFTHGIPSTLDRSQAIDEIRAHLGFQSFQMPEKIADAVRLISDVELWQGVAGIMGEDAQQVKSQLRLVVERRNKIAHESDLDPTYPNTRWPIQAVDVEYVSVLLRKIVEATDAVLQ